MNAATQATAVAASLERPGPYIEVRDLRVTTHGGKPLVDGVRFAAAKGRVVGLIGGSGSGKSLTCQSILGLLPHELHVAGSVCVDGAAVPQDNAGARWVRGGRVAMILQNPMSCFDPVFTIESHFRETLAAHGALRAENRSERYEACLREVGFPMPEAVLRLYPFQMSGGMLQRVMIALALVLEAPYVIADEATTDLDVVSQARVLDLLADLRDRRGMGVLLVTHDLSVIARLADEVLVMHEGRIVERGDTWSIFHAPREACTRALLAAHLTLYGVDAEGVAGVN